MKKILTLLLLLNTPFFIYSEEDTDAETIRTQATQKTKYFDSQDGSDDTDSLIFKEPRYEAEDYSSLLQFKAGFFQPQGTSIENDRYTFDYSASSLKTYLFEGAWDITIFELLGHWGLKTDVGYTFIKSFTKDTFVPLYLNIIPVGASLTYGLQFWKRQWIIPFEEGGVRYYFYAQVGKTDASYTSGGTLHPHWAGGLRLSINNILSTLTSFKLETPYFLEAQYREVMPAFENGGVNFSQKTYFAGFSIGI